MGLSLRNVQLAVYENAEEALLGLWRNAVHALRSVRSAGAVRERAYAPFRQQGVPCARSTSSLRWTKRRSTSVCCADFDKHKNSDFINALGELLPQKLIPVVIDKSGIDPREKVNSITKAQRAALLRVHQDVPGRDFRQASDRRGDCHHGRRVRPRGQPENHGVQKAAAPVFRR